MAEARGEASSRCSGEIFPGAAVARKEAYLGAGQQWPTGASAAAITTKRPWSAGGPGRVVGPRPPRRVASRPRFTDVPFADVPSRRSVNTRAGTRGYMRR